MRAVQRGSELPSYYNAPGNAETCSRERQHKFAASTSQLLTEVAKLNNQDKLTLHRFAQQYGELAGTTDADSSNANVQHFNVATPRSIEPELDSHDIDMADMYNLLYSSEDEMLDYNSDSSD